MSRTAALVALHAAVLLFGFAGLFGKWLDLSPVAIVLGRTAIAAAALGILRLRAGERAPFDVRLVTNGALLALHWVSFFAAIQVSTVADGPPRLRELSAVRARARALFLARRSAPPRKG